MKLFKHKIKTGYHLNQSSKQKVHQNLVLLLEKTIKYIAVSTPLLNEIIVYLVSKGLRCIAEMPPNSTGSLKFLQYKANLSFQYSFIFPF